MRREGLPESRRAVRVGFPTMTELQRGGGKARRINTLTFPPSLLLISHLDFYWSNLTVSQKVWNPVDGILRSSALEQGGKDEEHLEWQTQTAQCK